MGYLMVSALMMIDRNLAHKQEGITYLLIKEPVLGILLTFSLHYI
ncbi:hypothetical protein J2Z83_001559 [Virgibacillus natechei]|uniref:Uncharacterized protein n=1 Tax=Virgibacillus natechei TaxID=1216297 RepID=A0ABS4IFR5_9BACI|nr:hypothetical protein [Virgibacillus natechei]